MEGRDDDVCDAGPLCQEREERDKLTAVVMCLIIDDDSRRR